MSASEKSSSVFVPRTAMRLRRKGSERSGGDPAADDGRRPVARLPHGLDAAVVERAVGIAEGRDGRARDVLERRLAPRDLGVEVGVGELRQRAVRGAVGADLDPGRVERAHAVRREERVAGRLAVPVVDAAEPSGHDEDRRREAVRLRAAGSARVRTPA